LYAGIEALASFRIVVFAISVQIPPSQDGFAGLHKYSEILIGIQDIKHFHALGFLLSTNNIECVQFQIEVASMLKHISDTTRFSALALFAILAFAVSSATAQTSQAASATAPAEASPAQSAPATTGPISHNIKLNKIDGNINILVNPDGEWLFSGTAKAEKDKDYDVSLALRAKTGAIYVFHFVGDATHPIQFSKSGKSGLLKDDFSDFQKGHHYAWTYRYHESAAGKRAQYEERQRKREQLAREEKEAREKHNAKLEAEKKAEQKREAQKELAEERQQAAQQKSSGGGGGIGSTISSVVNTVGSVASGVASAVSDVGSFLGSIF
jgi:methionine-rich copper-binding protein CopC